jgi:hypothetical protein
MHLPSQTTRSRARQRGVRAQGRESVRKIALTTCDRRLARERGEAGQSVRQSCIVASIG